MCGIIGYCGPRDTKEILLAGLKRLEYRGYDSSGIAVGTKSGVVVVRRAGRLDKLEAAVAETAALDGAGYGIGHTRWATHGGVSEANSHPHADCAGKIAIVHNGIIENYQRLKDRLIAAGHVFRSETDSEVIAHLLEEHWNGDLTEAMQSVLPLLRGTYGIIAMHVDAPGVLCGARRGSPLIIGVGHGETFLASDVGAIAGRAEGVVYLNDGEIAAISDNGFDIVSGDSVGVERRAAGIELGDSDFEKNGFPHFMLKEIFEQPESVARAMAGRLDDGAATGKLGGLNMDDDALRAVKRVVIIGAGTSYFAGRIGAHFLESLAGVPAEAELSSEMAYRDMLVDPNALYFAVSQSGETADTLIALRELKRKGAKVMGICNAVGSTIARETDGGVYIHSGPEIAVASTKAFTSQITVFALFALIMARLRGMSDVKGQEFVAALRSLPDKMRQTLALDSNMKSLAEKYSSCQNFMYLGRGLCAAAACEGALKLKEISYIHAEGMAAGELKHGPISLVTGDMPSLFLIPDDGLADKNISSMKEVKARGGKVIAIASAGLPGVAAVADDVVEVPPALSVLAPFLMIIPMQLFAYHMAVILGRDVDRPRNLAKSVTVE